MRHLGPDRLWATPGGATRVASGRRSEQTAERAVWTVAVKSRTVRGMETARVDGVCDAAFAGIRAAFVENLEQRGEVGATVWPEFAAEGKSQTTLRMLLAHQAGLPSVRTRLPPGAMYDWDGMCEALAGQAPWWPPGEARGYHVGTYGFLVGEVLRRVTGRPIGALLQERLIGDRWQTPRTQALVDAVYAAL